MINKDGFRALNNPFFYRRIITMDNYKGTLEATYEVKNIASRYCEGHQKWSHGITNFIFKVKDGGESGELKVFENINVVNIKDDRDFIKESANSFFLSFKFYSGLHSLTYQEKCLRFFNSCFDETINNDQDIKQIIEKVKSQRDTENKSIHSASLTCGIGIGVSMEAEIRPVHLPDFNKLYPSLYNLFATVRRPLMTYIQTKELGDISQEYPDDMLKRWSLILEEIESDKGNADFANIMAARDFVSHSMCNRKKPINLLQRELPESVSVNDKNEKEARFDRGNQKHIQLVKKYANKAEERARKLLMQRLERHHD